MKRLFGRARGIGFAASVLVLAAGGVAVAVGSNVGPIMAQNAGGDMDATQQAAFWTAIGGGATGKLSIGAGLSNQAGALTAAVQSVFGRTGLVTLTLADVTTALGFTPLNKGGDTAAGLIGLTSAATVSAAGTNQGTCTPITAQTTFVTTVALNAGVCVNSAVGARQVIVNQGANLLTVWPYSGAAINGGATNAAATIAVGGWAAVTPVSSTQVYAGI